MNTENLKNKYKVPTTNLERYIKSEESLDVIMSVIRHLERLEVQVVNYRKVIEEKNDEIAELNKKIKFREQAIKSM
tara:strand:- start:269 stop:496 length:228 start_codon:yes stop_codon:yes gene_type:complete